MFSFLKLHCPQKRREGRRKRGRKEYRKRENEEGEGGRERGILLSANSLLKILIPLKASKELFFP